MTQRERDRLVALNKADKKLITQKQAAQQIGLSERQVRRLLAKLRSQGDRAVIHAARGRASNRKISAKVEKRAAAILSKPLYADFGPKPWRRSICSSATASTSAAKRCGAGWPRPGCGNPAGASRDERTCGVRGGVAAASWCNGTPPSTTGWKDAARSCT